MKKHYYLLLLLSPVFAVNAKAQDWQPKGALYEDKTIRVEIEYRLGNDPCSPNASLARFRYHIVRRGPHQPFHIAWRFDYFNCDHELRSQYNTLPITAKTPAYVTPDNNSFPARQIVNHISYTNISNHAPQDAVNYHPLSNTSLEPRNIEGRPQINAGETTLLTLKGGYLTSGASWKWYENDCNGTPIGTGLTLPVHPLQTTTYYVRAEGKNITPCVSFEVKVIGATSILPESISGPREVCAGNQVQLHVIGGKPGPNMRWVWYRLQTSGAAIGEGTAITVTAEATTTYYVRAEGPQGVTAARSWTVQVIQPPLPADGIIGPRTAAPGSYQTYSVQGLPLTGDMLWVWYQLIGGKYYRVGTGSRTTLQMPAKDVTVAVRAEGSCANSPYAELPVAIQPANISYQPQPIKETKPAPINGPTTNQVRMFINGGLAAGNTSQLNKSTNYFATIGVGNRLGAYLRYKFATDPAKSSYQTTNGQIVGYDQPGYYQYTGQRIAKRTAYTGGLFFGSRVIAIYLGGGYGEYQSLYEISQRLYTDGYYRTAYVLDQSVSLKGAEFEGGLLLRTSFFNLMVGAASVQGKYMDYHAGIGFNF
ncbi:MAG: hypothetical protein V4592_08130 [Bacteroidota bacterium]